MPFYMILCVYSRVFQEIPGYKVTFLGIFNPKDKLTVINLK